MKKHVNEGLLNLYMLRSADWSLCHYTDHTMKKHVDGGLLYAKSCWMKPLNHYTDHTMKKHVNEGLLNLYMLRSAEWSLCHYTDHTMKKHVDGGLLYA